jgi:hypothetical protein
MVWQRVIHADPPDSASQDRASAQAVTGHRAGQQQNGDQSAGQLRAENTALAGPTGHHMLLVDSIDDLR